MSGGSAIRGSRVGAGPMGEAERGEAAPREYVSYFCANHHVIRPAFAAEAEIPDTW
ncbi:RNA polymerase-binding protein RbpA, partial [Lactobacillus crispatus]|nr:RNA polymerase-binding protein RbpA [Lactobacillus crispatus]